MTAEERRDEHAVVVLVPEELPVLTKSSARVLLGILVELTTVELLDQPPGGDRDDG
jgi:hypothetical protein